MTYRKHFEEYVAICSKYNSFIGIGNPNANTLIICNDIKKDILPHNPDWYYNNNEYWEYHIKNNSNRRALGLDFIPPKGSELRNKEHNWRKYQCFNDLLFKKTSKSTYTDTQYPRTLSYKPRRKYRIDFLERFFIIEFSTIEKMRNIIGSKYIYHFPITLLDNIDIEISDMKGLFSIAFEIELKGLDSCRAESSPGNNIKFENSVFSKNGNIYQVFNQNNIFEIAHTKVGEKIINEMNYIFWEYGYGIIDNVYPQYYYLRGGSLKLKSGTVLPQHTKIYPNYEGLALYNNEVIEAASIPENILNKKNEQNSSNSDIVNMNNPLHKFLYVRDLMPDKLPAGCDRQNWFNLQEVFDPIEITKSDLLRYKKIEEYTIYDDEPFKYCNNLTTIDIHEFTFECEYKNLKQLQNIKYLSCNNIDNLLILKNWHKLEELIILNAPSLTDIEELENKIALKKLNISSLDNYNDIDCSPINSLINIEELTLCIPILPSLEFLANKKQLKILRISKNLITDENKDNDITDISPLSESVNLKEIKILDSRIEDISPLKNCTLIEELEITNAEIKNISAIENMQALEHLNLENNNISLVPIKCSLKSLCYLNISHNSITDISFLKNMKNLQWLDVSHNNITDFTPLKYLNKACEVDIMGNS